MSGALHTIVVGAIGFLFAVLVMCTLPLYRRLGVLPEDFRGAVADLAHALLYMLGYALGAVAASVVNCFRLIRSTLH